MSAVTDLLAILDLEPIERNIFRGRSPDEGWQRVFGGQVLGQALVAASRTVEDRRAHSLQAYFLLPGDPKVPIIYEVDRIRDGKSFATRRVVAIQHGRAIFSMSASFQIAEEGLDHGDPIPDVALPETLASEEDLRERYMTVAAEPIRRYWQRQRPIEFRPTDLTAFLDRKSVNGKRHVWVRATERLPDDPGLHLCVLAYASDVTLLDTALLGHRRSIFDPDIQAASLDHAMWFHRPFRADEWLLFTQDSPSASGSRGFTRGTFHDRAGNLIASVAQEGLIRVHGGR